MNPRSLSERPAYLYKFREGSIGCTFSVFLFDFFFAHALPPYQTLSAASQPPLRGFDIKADTTATPISWAFEAFAKASKRLRSVCGGFEAASKVCAVLGTISKRSRIPRNKFAAFGKLFGGISKQLRRLRSHLGAVSKAFGTLQRMFDRCEKCSKTLPTEEKNGQEFKIIIVQH